MSEIRALVVSDSHGDVDNMCRAVELVRPDLLLHLGDGWHDAELLAGRYPELRIEKVPGNCDYRSGEPLERLLPIGDKLVLLCHGHTLGVKTDLGMVLRAARERGADAVLFGHTHKPFVDIRCGVAMLNPGSVGNRLRPTYGTLTVGDGKCVPAVFALK
ncbi:MAG: YfcE family phosphodiesterase [Ruminococcaceae bacterium]|nr:YfcE family phosphodiesterase [Oscillospiraceae bacterium]